ncbi:MAG: molecular chaperone HscC [Myxococcota bacterium]
MIVGIDLGTTNSLVAVFREGEDGPSTQLIPNALGHVLTPSAVSVDEQGDVLVGLPARERAPLHPRDTALAFKRWMGTSHRVTLGKRVFSPEELSALVLRSLKSDAEAHLGEPVKQAVITVPAYFNDVQRKATRAAAELAGLEVAGLLNEPTAAGLAYGLAERPDHTTFLVFDLGGGTFDVSVLEYFEGVVEVRASAGDTRLGGEDFVRVLQDLVIQETRSLSDKQRQKLREGTSLWRTVEQLKRDLTDRDDATATFVVDGVEHHAAVTRNQFEQCAGELLHRLRRPVERALMDARLEPSELQEVVLVGGATRMPMVRQMVARLFQRLPLRLINPDETVARGAAVQAALKVRNAALNEVVLTDVMPYSLGIITMQEIHGRKVGDAFSPIIERNTPVPVSRVETYHTVSDDQRVVRLDVRQGESPVGSENLQLGELEVRVPPRPAGEVSIQVRFTYDANGILEVDVKEDAGGNTAHKVIMQSQGVMTPGQVQQALKRMAGLKIHPRDQQENRYFIERAKRLYEDRLGDVRRLIGMQLAAFEAALDTQDARTVQTAREKFQQFLDEMDRGFRL